MSALYGTYARSDLAFERGGACACMTSIAGLSRFPSASPSMPWAMTIRIWYVAEGRRRKGLAHVQRVHIPEQERRLGGWSMPHSRIHVSHQSGR